DGKADSRDRARAAEPREQRVVAAACNELAPYAPVRVVQLEHDTGVIIEATAECGGKADASDVDPPRRQKAGAAFEQIERRIEGDVGIARKDAQLRSGLVGIADDREEPLNECSYLSRQRRLRAERRLLEEAIGNLTDRSSPDGGNTGN